MNEKERKKERNKKTKVLETQIERKYIEKRKI